MSAVGVVFAREIRVYLRSPVGWFVAAAVLLLDGLLFYAQALGPGAGERLSGEVLAAFFYNASGLTAVAAVVLSVRLIAEERQAGTHVLLSTSPIRDRDVVLGKFLSALVFLTGVTLLTLYIPLLVAVNGKIAWAQVVVGYTGLGLLGSAVLSIGLFASALSRHTLVAAAAGAVLTGTLFLLWPLSQIVDPPISLVFAGLSMHGRHFSGFQAGVLHSRDVFYYLAVTYFFLLATVRVLEAKRWA